MDILYTMSTDHYMEQNMEKSPQQILRELSKVKADTVSSLVTLTVPANYQCI